jgi:hypothetical protein
MKLKFSILTALGAAGLFVAGCNSTGSGTTSSAPAGGAAKAYPLEVCLVSGEKLGSMGEPVVLVHQGQEIKLCCKSCKPDFEKEPAKFLGKLAAK